MAEAMSYVVRFVVAEEERKKTRDFIKGEEKTKNEKIPIHQ